MCSESARQVGQAFQPDTKVAIVRLESLTYGLEKYTLAKGDVTPNTSGRQELFENVVNRYVF
jgi:xylose isomerase